MVDREKEFPPSFVESLGKGPAPLSSFSGSSVPPLVLSYRAHLFLALKNGGGIWDFLAFLILLSTTHTPALRRALRGFLTLHSTHPSKIHADTPHPNENDENIHQHALSYESVATKTGVYRAA